MTEPVAPKPRKRAPAKKAAPPVVPLDDDPVEEMEEVIPGVVAEVPPKDKKVLAEPTYNIVKKSVQIILPAIGAFYLTIAELWGLPKANEVVGTIAAFNLLLGVILTISQNRYSNSEARFGGDIEISQEEDRKVFSLNLNGDPEELANKNEVTFKIKS